MTYPPPMTTLQEREHDPVEAAERAAVFETWKARQK